MKKELFDLYSDYLLSSFGKTTATQLSSLVDGAYSHDQITRLLSCNNFDSKTLWQYTKPVVRKVEQEDGVLIVDDTIQEKLYSDENNLIAWHFDHTFGRSVKGINLLNFLYHVGDISLPVAYQLIEKPIQYTDLKTKKVKRKAEKTKNEYFREMLKISCNNQLQFKYVLADSWFSSNENMMYIRHECDRHFIMAGKSNRKVSLSEEDKKQGRSQRIDSVNFTEEKPIKVWLSGVDFPVLIDRQVFTNKDGSKGILYLLCSDLECNAETLKAIYKKRWKVEVFHKTLKSNASMAKSPSHTVLTQSNHLFMSIYSVFRLEILTSKLKLNHFELRAKLYLSALRSSFQELRQMAGA